MVLVGKEHRSWFGCAMMTRGAAGVGFLCGFCGSGCGCWRGLLRGGDFFRGGGLGVGGDFFGRGGEDRGGGAGEGLVEVGREIDEIGDGGEVVVIEIAGGPGSWLIEVGGEVDAVGATESAVDVEEHATGPIELHAGKFRMWIPADLHVGER